MTQNPPTTTPPGQELAASDPPSPPTVGGRRVVVLMFLFGIAVVAGFWTYWALYDRPLAPLRRAIQAELPETTVQLAAGVEKKSTTAQLRVVVQTPYEPAVSAKADRDADRIERLVQRWPDADQYDTLEIVLYQTLGERRDDYWSRRVTLR